MMLRARATDKTVIAVMGQDGRVYFDFPAKPVRARLPMSDWISVSLSLFAAAVIVAIALIV